MEAGKLKSQHDNDYNPQIPKKQKLNTLRARVQRLKLCCKTSFDASGYINILRTNYNYRLYFISHLCQHAGDWFVRVAALLTIDRLNGSATALSFYVLTEKIPPVLLSPLGGIISDSYDKRKLMIFYDSVASVVVLGFIVAVQLQSISLFYIIAASRATIKSFFHPNDKSIVPFFVDDGEDLKRVVTMNGMAWSAMLMVGGPIAGYATAYIGVQACFVIDCVTYIISAVVIYFVQGTFTASPSTDLHTTDSITTSTKSDPPKSKTHCKSLLLKEKVKNIITFKPCQSSCLMFFQLLSYLSRCGFGLLVLFKASGTLTWGPADILNVSFAHVPDDEVETSKRIGNIYLYVGLGCLIGPVLLNSLYVDGNRPKTLQIVCIFAFLFLIIGWLGISYISIQNFNLICIFIAIRTIGVAIIWQDSTLLLQSITSREMLGRVLGLEYALSELTEASIAFITGRLEDSGHDKHEIAEMAAIIGATMLFLWTTYHAFGGGANKSRFNEKVIHDVEHDIYDSAADEMGGSTEQISEFHPNVTLD